MCQSQNISDAFPFIKRFSKTAGGSEAEQAGNAQLSWEAVELPHTWNGTDGQDGGND